MTGKTASVLIPVIAAVALLYRGIAGLRLSVATPETALVILAVAAAALVCGAIAAWGDGPVRVLVLSATTLVVLDLTLRPSRLFEAVAPTRDLAAERDARRVADLDRIQGALEQYIRDVGWLPEPAYYGERAGSTAFWPDWWDVSSADGDGDGDRFLDFLVERGVAVPLDPLNTAGGDGDPRSGQQYVYALVPPGYAYEGGACAAWRDRWVYLVAATDLETEFVRPPQRTAGSGCGCLWRDAPDFFQRHFDYVRCGSFAR